MRIPTPAGAKTGKRGAKTLGPSGRTADGGATNGPRPRPANPQVTGPSGRRPNSRAAQQPGGPTAGRPESRLRQPWPRPCRRTAAQPHSHRWAVSIRSARTTLCSIASERGSCRPKPGWLQPFTSSTMHFTDTSCLEIAEFTVDRTPEPKYRHVRDASGPQPVKRPVETGPPPRTGLPKGADRSPPGSPRTPARLLTGQRRPGPPP